MNPNQLALQNKQALEATGAFVVQPDGSVRMSADRGGGFAPPWVWAGAIPQASGNDPQSQALRIQLSTPASDPSSPWRDSVGYDAGGPFSKHSSWDSQNGTYQGGIDWGTLLGTIGVGSLFAAPALAGLAGGGGGAAGGASAGAGAGPAASLAGADASLLPSTTIGTGMMGPIAGRTGADLGGLASSTIGSGMMGPIAGSAPSGAMNAALSAGGGASSLMKALAGIGGLAGGAIGGHIGQSGAVPQQLTDLLDLMSKRTQAQNPLFNAVNSGLYQMLPTYAKTGGPPTAV
jgi:hypothetical protein